MRKILALAAALALAAWAAGAPAQQKPPPRLEPLPEPPLPPNARDAGLEEPRVIIQQQQEDIVEEIRDNGRVVMLKVTPPGAAPYYLLDTTGNGNWIRRDPTDPGVRVPMWVIRSFD
jgi:hypothetical protein